MNRDLFIRGGNYLARHPIRVLAALVIIALMLTYFLHRSSYCIAERRFVSDREMINAAIKDEMRPINGHALYGTGRNPGEKYLPIKDAEEFELLNPGCCRILTGDEESKALYFYSLLSGVLGYYAVVVGIDHKIRYLDEQGIGRARPVYSTVPVSSCGKVQLETYRGG
jgi:hypothetical protein